MKARKLIAILALVAVTSGCDQFVARNFGGNVNQTLPNGALFLGITWKADSLWVSYYNPATKECIFTESSSMNVLEGKVTIPNCLPAQLSSGINKENP